MREAQIIAATYQIPLEKFLKDLQKRDGLNDLYEQATREKVLKFLEDNAKVETVAVKA